MKSMTTKKKIFFTSGVKFVKKQRKNSKKHHPRLHKRHTHEGDSVVLNPPFSGMDMFHEVSEDTPFLPPYSVYRFALWNFLLGLGTHWGQGSAGEAQRRRRIGRSVSLEPWSPTLCFQGRPLSRARGSLFLPPAQLQPRPSWQWAQECRRLRGTP